MIATIVAIAKQETEQLTSLISDAIAIQFSEVIRMYTKRELLLDSVNYDVELQIRNRHIVAKEIADYWKFNCPEEDFYKNCMNEICERLGHKEGPVPDEAYEIWDIIKKNI